MGEILDYANTKDGGDGPGPRQKPAGVGIALAGAIGCAFCGWFKLAFIDAELDPAGVMIALALEAGALALCVLAFWRYFKLPPRRRPPGSMVPIIAAELVALLWVVAAARAYFAIA